MPLYLVIAQSPVPIGAPDRAVFNCPGSAEQLLVAAVRKGQLPSGIQYDCHQLPHGDPAFVMLCAHNVMPPAMSAAHVAGGQPVGTPQAMPGHDRPEGQRDSLGFQALGDFALPGGQDNVYGDVNDGTFADMVRTGQGWQEQPRQ